jgi:hypothetical protein
MFEISEDLKEKIITICLFFVEGFRIIIASMLCLFIPQNCNNNLCTVDDILLTINNFKLVIIIFNCITLLAFIGMYLLEYYREYWTIENLDIDESKSIHNLKNVIDEYSDIKQDLIDLNNNYYTYSIVMVFIYGINFLLSSIYILGYNYLDYRTTFNLIINLYLVVDKLYTNIIISSQSHTDLIAYSAYMKTPVAYNTIDHKYSVKKEPTLVFKSTLNIDYKPNKMSNIENINEMLNV